MFDVDMYEHLFDDLFVLDWDGLFFLNPFYSYKYNLLYYNDYLSKIYGISEEIIEIRKNNNEILGVIDKKILESLNENYHINVKYKWLNNFVNWLRFYPSKINFEMLRFHADSFAIKIKDRSNSVAKDIKFHKDTQ